MPEELRLSRRRKLLTLVLLMGLLILPQATNQTLAADNLQTVFHDPTKMNSLISELDSLQNYIKIKDKAPKPGIFAKSYLLMDAQTSEILIEKNGFENQPVASTTKMVTALTALKLFKPDEVVTVSSRAPLVVGSKIDLKTGEKIKVIDLIKGLLIQSGNDAAWALAEHYSQKPGDISTFVERMNEFVKENNLQTSRFADPAGLNDELGYSSAFELAHVARVLMKRELLSKIVSISEDVISSVDGQITHELKSSNRLLLTDSPYYLSGVMGIKTGYTPKAGHCLVAAYNHYGRLLIGVILHTDEFSATASAKQMRNLFIWARDNLEIGIY